VERSTTSRPPAPREHGAWGILLVPFATGAGVSGVFDGKTLLLLVSVLGFYLARTSFLRRQWRWLAVLLGVSLAAAAPLLLVWQRWWLAALAAVAVPLAARPTRQSLSVQLLGVAGLTLTAPAAWYVGTGRLGAMAALLWLLNAIYFAGGVFYVRMHLRAATDRYVGLASGRSNLLYHLAALGSVLALAAMAVVPWSVVAAMLPAVVRAVVGTVRLHLPLQIKKLGWTEVAHSVVFGALLIWALR